MALFREAEERLPLPDLLDRRGESEFRARNARCPFCSARHKFGIFKHGATSRWFFKCHKPDCVANDPATGRDAIGWIAIRDGLSRKDAALEFLKLAVPEKLAQQRHVRTPEPPAPDPAGRRSDAETSPPAGPFHALWQKLTLNADDHAAFKKKRGFTDETIRSAGLRSNGPQNEHHLDALADTYSPEDLVAAGIFKPDYPYPIPAGQLRGYDIKGELSHPGLIPYFSPEGLPYWIRPHKGGLTRPRDPDEQFLEDDERPCHAEIYIPPGAGELIAEQDGLCVITEGEYKGLALRQCRIGSLVIPGIQMFRNREFFGRLTRLLDQFGVRHVVIIYDNEVQDDQTLKDRYKADPWKRNEALVYAIVLQRELRYRFARPGTSCRIGKLPDEFREQGKADFDGILARCVREHGEAAGTEAARKIFLKSVREAVTSDERGDLFPSQDERIINWRVQRLEHTPALLVGGEREIKLANICRTRGRHPESGRPEKADTELADLFSSVVGCYYLRRHPSREERPSLLKRKEELMAARDTLKRELEQSNPIAQSPNQQILPANVFPLPGIPNATVTISSSSSSTPDPEKVSLLAFVRAQLTATLERLRGLPERISDCSMECHYRVHTAAGQVDRLVRIKNSKDLKKPNPTLFRLTASDASSHQNFRKWLYGNGEGVWHEGQKALELLKEDLDHQAYLRDIHEISSVGLDDKSKLWFFEDVAYGPDGARIFPDHEGIFWFGGLGYRIRSDNQSTSSNSFAQGLPRLTKPQGLTPELTPEEYSTRGHIKGLFKTLAQDIYDTTGNYEGWLALGLLLAYAIAPETLRAEGHPAPWFNGRKGQGKSTLIRLLMRLWGFRSLEGIGIGKTTSNAISRILCQYSFLPVYFDEANLVALDDDKVEILKYAFQHQNSFKGKPTEGFDTYGLPPRTSPVVGGESTSNNPALNSRFGFINIVAANRLGDDTARFHRMLAESDHYFRIGDWLMNNRPAFLKHALDVLAVFNESPRVRAAIPDARLRFVHGTALACMRAACDLLEINETRDPDPAKGSYQFEPSPESASVDHRPRTMNGFYDFLLNYGGAALRQVQEEDYLHRFWSDVIHAISRKKGAREAFYVADIKWAADGTHYGYRAAETHGGEFLPPKTGHQRVCFVIGEIVYDTYQIDYRQRFQASPPLRLQDIKTQMESAPYYIRPPSRDRRHAPKINGQKVTCMCINMELKPQTAADESGDPEESTHLFPLAPELLIALATIGTPDLDTE